MERLLTVEFGPSRSKRFGKAVAQARSGPGECAEVEPDRYKVTFLLGEDAAAYSGLARLLEWVRHWRATEVYEGDELVSTFHTKEMAWCASFQLSSSGACRERFEYGILPRCALCPLFDAERAIRAGLRENPVPVERGEISADAEPAESAMRGFGIFSSLDFLELLDGELPDWIDADFLVPDFPPEEWGEPVGEEPPG